mgnify:CR=1 FL=1
MLNDEQYKAAKAVERALIKAGKAGLAGGVYDGTFLLFPKELDREDTVTEIMGGNDEIGYSVPDHHIDLDGGAGV